jgi:hypothetical protein
MPVDTDGRVLMRGESGSGVPVRVQADGGRLKISSGEAVLGDWSVSEIGLHSVPDGFAIRAEGEEFLLKANDPVGLAEELGMTAVTPRLARQVAASHNPEERPLPPEVDREAIEHQVSARTMAIAFALGGVLVLLGGSFLRIAPTSRGAAEPSVTSFGGVEFWVAFVVGGLVMVALAYAIALQSGWARVAALIVVAALVGLFGYMISATSADSSYFTAYGFIAGGTVVGVAVLFSGSLRASEQ